MHKRGCMNLSLTGAIIGDIIGSRFEFEKEIPDWKTCDLFHKYSVFTDDTVQSLAIGMAAILDKDYKKALLYLCNRYIFVGYGGNFTHWLNDSENTPHNSWGNGSAMRVSSIGMLANSLEEAENMAKVSAMCSHNSIEGIKGAKAIAGCTYLAGKQVEKSQILDYALSLYPESQYIYHPKRSLKEYRDKYKFEVSCQKSVPVAIRCFLESNDYISCLRNVLFMNGDTDTLGAMSGSIAGAYYGFGSLCVEKILRQYLDDELFDIWKSIKEYSSKQNSI